MSGWRDYIIKIIKIFCKVEVMSEWQEIKLGELIDINQSSIGRNYEFENIRYYDISSIGTGVAEDPKNLSISEAPSRAKRIIKDGDTILATVRPGNRSFYYFKQARENDIASTGFAVISHKNNLIDNKFLYYLISAQSFTNYLVSNEQGATYPAITPSVINRAKINLPPLPTQQKIAKILSNYDDLIENNLKCIKLLEESARLTYEEWFLRFRIDGKKLDIDPEFDLPIGWRKVKVNSLVSYYIGGGWGEESISDKFSDEAYVIRGTDIDDIPYGNLGGAPLRYHKASNLASRKLQNKDIVFEVSGGSRTEGVAKSLLMTDNLLEQFNNDVMCASFCKLVRPKEQYLGNILLLSFKYLRSTKATEVFEIKGASSIINYNWEAFIKHHDLIMPSHDVLLNFDKKVDVLVNEIYNLGHQNQLLKEARDILLPRLMTGMIDTDDMDIAV